MTGGENGKIRVWNEKLNKEKKKDSERNVTKKWGVGGRNEDVVRDERRKQ